MATEYIIVDKIPHISASVLPKPMPSKLLNSVDQDTISNQALSFLPTPIANGFNNQSNNSSFYWR